jgi:hypothetical protein
VIMQWWEGKERGGRKEEGRNIVTSDEGAVKEDCSSASQMNEGERGVRVSGSLVWSSRPELIDSKVGGIERNVRSYLNSTQTLTLTPNPDPDPDP